MTLDEAIKNAEEVADVCEYEASKYDMSDSYERYVACEEGKCTEEHRQLAEWLKDYKRLLEQKPNAWSLDDAREDFMYDVYNILDFLPTNDEANQIIDSFNRVTSSIKQEPKTVNCNECSHECPQWAKNIAKSNGCIGYIPSAEPQTGHWIYDRTRDWDGECKYECSECGMGSDVDYDYCMRCGAKMFEPQENEDKE